MKVFNVDFDKASFRESFIDFFSESSPTEDSEYGSIQSRIIQATDLIEELRESDISLFSSYGGDYPIMYCFFDIQKEKKQIYINFCFPGFRYNSTKDSNKMAEGFYSCCLKAMSICGYDYIEAEIRRGKRKKSMLLFLSKFYKACVIEKKDKNSLHVIKIKKQSLLNEIKKLQL